MLLGKKYKKHKAGTVAQRSTKCKTTSMKAFIFVILSLFVGHAYAITTPIVSDSEFDVPGVRIGAFTANTSLSTAVTYDSNIFEAANADSDIIYLMSPRLRFRSNFVRHSLQFDFSLDNITYDQAGENDVTNFSGKVTSVFNVRHGLDLTVEAMARVNHDDLGDDAEDITDAIIEPLKYKDYEVKATLQKQMSRYTAALGIGYTKTDYSLARTGSGLRNIDFRDVEEINVTAQLNYKLTPKLELITEAEGTFSDYKRAEDDGTIRDSTTWRVGNTLSYQATSKTNLRFSVEHTKEEFEDASLADTDWLPSYSLAVNWVPSAFWDLTVNWSFSESGTDFEEGTSSSETTSYGLVVRYRPRRNLTLTSNFTYSLEDSIASGATEETETYTYLLTADYKIHNGVNFSLNYGYEKEDAVSNDDSYEQHIVQGSVKVQF